MQSSKLEESVALFSTKMPQYISKKKLVLPTENLSKISNF